jgi:HNH endonuclease
MVFTPLLNMKIAFKNPQLLSAIPKMFVLVGQHVCLIGSSNPAGAVVKQPGKHTSYRHISLSEFNTYALAHHISYALHHGHFPEGIVDHKDQDGLNNSPDNLRLVTPSQSAMNRRRYVSSATGIKGVSFANDGRAKPYPAEVKASRVRVLNRYFATLEEATVAVQEARTKHHGEFAHHA